MRPTAHIDKLRRAARRRVGHLRFLCDGLDLPLQPEWEVVIAHTVIEALNVWSGFCRSYYLSVASGAKDCSGHRVTTEVAIQSRDHALTLAIHEIRPDRRGRMGPWQHWDEPRWHQVDHFLRSLQAIMPSSIGAVYGALGRPTRVFTDLPVFRNYYAHKQEKTAKDALALAVHYALPRPASPSQLLCSRPQGAGQPILHEWLDDLRLVVQGIC